MTPGKRVFGIESDKSAGQPLRGSRLLDGRGDQEEPLHLLPLQPWGGKCPEHYTREEVPKEGSAELLDRLRFDDEVPDWVPRAPRASRGDEKQHHEDAICRIQSQYRRLQNRIDAM